MALLSRCAVVD